jgi:hypothetical protein
LDDRTLRDPDLLAGTRGLTEALERGAPLAEIVVRFRAGVDFVAATQAFNALGDDLDLSERPWYDDRALRVGSATKEALDVVESIGLTQPGADDQG